MSDVGASKHRIRRDRPIGIDLFAGAGGLSLGFEQAGFDVAAAFDLDSINTETYRSNFPDSISVQADLSRLSAGRLLKIAGASLGSVDVVFGGPPCQGFSLIGRREKTDARNRLLFDFARLVIGIRPRYFVMENVRGLLAGHALDVLESFKRRIRRGGYEIVEPIRVLNAKSFGVPQQRERAFVLGYQRGLPSPKYPQALPNHEDSAQSSLATVWDAIGDLPNLDGFPELLNSDTYFGSLGPPSQYVGFLQSSDLRRRTSGQGERENHCRLSGCLRTQHSPETRRRFERTEPGTTEPISRLYRMKCDGLAPTLRAGTGPEHGSHTAARPIHPTAPRCISTREAARLHSFPDWFEFHPTKWHGFRQVGNSVPPKMALAVAGSLFDILKDAI